MAGYPYGTKDAPAVGSGAPGLPRRPEIRGEFLFDVPGTYYLPIPEGVTTICAAVRSGAGGALYNNNGGISTFYVSSGGGAGFAWKNDIPVAPGDLLQIVVGAGGAASSQATVIATPAGSGGESWVKDVSICRASGGVGGTQGVAAAGGTVTAGDGGGTGGSGAFMSTTSAAAHASGGGAAGYTGNGGNGVANADSTLAAGNPGTGGGGGSGTPGSPSGGVGMFGAGASGTGGTLGSGVGTTGGTGKGGSAGRNGALNATRAAGLPGDGAGGSVSFQSLPDTANGEDGAVRIVFGPGRAFPSTDVGMG